MDKTKIDWADSTWNPVPEHEGYYASKDGQILSIKRGKPRIMKQITSKDGHKYVFMYDNAIMKKVWAHRAVLSAFSGYDGKGLECRHLDDNSSNNTLKNLAWGTRLQNVADKRRNGGIPTGERSGTHKLTEQQVLEIRATHGTKPLRKIAEQYGVSHTCVRRAALGIKWAHLRGV
jgi:hypothetical protein